MYDSKRLASGVGVLFVLWASVGLLVVSTGVGVSVPLSGTGGFNISASYLGASESRSVPAQTAGTNASVAKFEIEESYAQNLQLAKTVNVSDFPGVEGNIRLLIQAQEASIDGVMYKTDHITADRAVWRGFVLDERRADDPRNQFVAYAGPNPNSAVNTDDPLTVAGSEPGAVEPGTRPAFELHGAHIAASKLTADQVSLTNLGVVVQYDPDSDGTYEYGS